MLSKRFGAFKQSFSVEFSVLSKATLYMQGSPFRAAFFLCGFKKERTGNG
jgi:hypothetical protein